jgi:hypothetical protein
MTIQLDPAPRHRCKLLQRATRILGAMRALYCVLATGLMACRPDPGALHLQRELAFFQGLVDPQREAGEVRRVLSQRRMRVVREQSSQDLVSLAASDAAHGHSAIRVITRRGVVLSFDAELDAPLFPHEVSLADGLAGTARDDLSLVGVVVRPRDLDTGCLRLFRILPDGRASEVRLDVSGFGDRACVASLYAAQGRFFGNVAFPGLAAVAVPTIGIELQVAQVLLGQEAELARTLRPADGAEWLVEARRSLFAPERILGQVEFSKRHCVGVGRAAVSHAEGRSPDEQRAAYLSALLPVRAGSPEAGVVADTLAHLDRGWIDSAPVPADAAVGDEPVGGLDATETVVEPDEAVADEIAK